MCVEVEVYDGVKESSNCLSPGFNPLILAATAGRVEVKILLDKGGDIEAQSERTKDTPLSLACSGGRQEVLLCLSYFVWITGRSSAVKRDVLA